MRRLPPPGRLARPLALAGPPALVRLAPLARLAPLLVLSGCLPWTVGQTAEVVDRGRVEHGPGLALLAPPDDPVPFPAPQYRVAIGTGRATDVAATYALPLTFEGRVKARVYGGSRFAGAVAAGVGIHGLPDIADAGATYWFPYATVALHASTRGDGAARWAALRAIAPFHPGEDFAATLWVAPQVGLELGRGSFRWGPEVGAVVPTLHPEDTQAVVAVGLRWGGRR